MLVAAGWSAPPTRWWSPSTRTPSPRGWATSPRTWWATWLKSPPCWPVWATTPTPTRPTTPDRSPSSRCSTTRRWVRGRNDTRPLGFQEELPPRHPYRKSSCQLSGAALIARIDWLIECQEGLLLLTSPPPKTSLIFLFFRKVCAEAQNAGKLFFCNAGKKNVLTPPSGPEWGCIAATLAKKWSSLSQQCLIIFTLKTWNSLSENAHVITENVHAILWILVF